MLNSVSAIDIAFAGVKAQRTRMNVIATNIANANATTTPGGGAFRRQLAIFRGEQLGPQINPKDLGVRVKNIINDMSPLRTVYDPAHPHANQDGYVEYPNVDLAIEMADLVSTHRSFDANIAVITSSKRMTQKALEIIQP